MYLYIYIAHSAMYMYMCVERERERERERGRLYQCIYEWRLVYIYIYIYIYTCTCGRGFAHFANWARFDAVREAQEKRASTGVNQETPGLTGKDESNSLAAFDRETVEACVGLHVLSK